MPYISNHTGRINIYINSSNPLTNMAEKGKDVVRSLRREIGFPSIKLFIGATTPCINGSSHCVCEVVFFYERPQHNKRCTSTKLHCFFIYAICPGCNTVSTYYAPTVQDPTILQKFANIDSLIDEILAQL